MTIWQMFFGVSIQIICINLAPQIMSYFLALIFIIFSFAIIRITFWESLFAWFVVSLFIAIDLAITSPDRFGITNLSNDEKIIVLVSFSSILFRVILLGYYNTLIKQRLFVMIDIDHFKNVNDTFGHPIGDKILAEISKFIYENIRNVEENSIKYSDTALYEAKRNGRNRLVCYDNI